MNIIHKKFPLHIVFKILLSFWCRFWMSLSGLSLSGKIATRLATWGVPPYYRRVFLAGFNRKGFISPLSTIYHDHLEMKGNIFIDDHVLIYQSKNAGAIEIGKNVNIYRYTTLQNGSGGNIVIGSRTCIQQRCQFSAYIGSIIIGNDVQIAPNCSFYSYDHGFKPDLPIFDQPLQSNGGIIIEDDVWIGVGVIILDGVRIGKGSVIGAGSVVTQEIPAGCVATGMPARVIKFRKDINS